VLLCSIHKNASYPYYISNSIRGFCTSVTSKYYVIQDCIWLLFIKQWFVVIANMICIMEQDVIWICICIYVEMQILFFFLVSDQTAINIFNHFANHHIQNVSIHGPLSLSFTFEDVYNHIFDRYMLMSWIPCNSYKKSDPSSSSYNSNASLSPLSKQTKKWSINPFHNSMEE
jgi:hypothetical protein